MNNVVSICETIREKQMAEQMAEQELERQKQVSKNIKLADIIGSLAHDIEFHIACIKSLKLDEAEIGQVECALDVALEMLSELATPS